MEYNLQEAAKATVIHTKNKFEEIIIKLRKEDKGNFSNEAILKLYSENNWEKDKVIDILLRKISKYIINEAFK